MTDGKWIDEKLGSAEQMLEIIRRLLTDATSSEPDHEFATAVLEDLNGIAQMLTTNDGTVFVLRTGGFEFKMTLKPIEDETS